MPTTHLRGAARLATDATAGLTDLVEAMHERIARLPGVKPPAEAGRTSGIAGLVYKSIRGVTHLVGGSLDALLAVLAPTLDPRLAPGLARPERDAVVAALNGVLGDYLVATANPLACAMSLRLGGQALPLQPEALAAALPPATGTVFLMAHGLCLNDLQWQRNGHDHGAALAAEVGATALYLRYNSGLHVSINGRQLAHQLQDLFDAWPQPLPRSLPRVVLIGHSMGGLVLRSAMHHASQAGMAWPQQVDDLVCLGTPHHGAPLERAGHWVDKLLGATPYAAPFARLGKVRSAGITDLRHGNLLDEDWLGRDRFAHRADHRLPLPLPEGPRCWAVAACLGDKAEGIKAAVLGDGLVPVDSALGRHRDPARVLAFAPERQHVAQGLSHLDLLSDAQVYGKLRSWLLPQH